MTARICYHFDENIDPAVADGLRRQGVDVTTTREVGLGGAMDEAQLGFARENSRVLFTMDDDFLKMAMGGQPHCGIVYCRQQRRSVGQIIRGLLLICDCLTAGDMQNHVEFL
jgi:predicted nuclease of predicted toxin-antitoxin system